MLNETLSNAGGQVNQRPTPLGGTMGQIEDKIT